MPSLTFEDGGLVYRDGALGLDQDCCCDQESPPDPGECPQEGQFAGYFVNGPTFTYRWTAFGWQLLGNGAAHFQTCINYGDQVGTSSGGVGNPPFVGAFIGEEIEFPGCICGS